MFIETRMSIKNEDIIGRGKSNALSLLLTYRGSITAYRANLGEIELCFTSLEPIAATG